MNDKESMQPIEPVVMAVIGTGTGDGGAPLKDGQMLKTPDHQPNVVIQVITPAVAILVRALNVFIVTLLGILPTAMGTHAIPANDFFDLFLKCSSLAAGGTVLMVLKDMATILSGLEKKFPLATGSV